MGGKGSGGRCLACWSDRADEINEALDRHSYREVARRFGISPPALHRHAHNHRRRPSADDLLDEVVCPSADEPLVYFARLGPLVKIGISKNPHKRVRDLLGPELVAWEVGGRKREQNLHRAFRRHHLKGEWFYLRGGLAAYVLDRSRGRRGLEDLQVAETATYTD